MSIFRSKIFWGIVLATAIIVAGGLSVSAKDMPALTSLFSNTVVTVTATPIPTLPPAPPWTIAQKIVEAENLLKNVQLIVGTTPISYTESRFASVNGKLSTTVAKFKEPEKQIALAALNMLTGEIKIVTIVKHGADLISPAGWTIDVLQRPNGIQWNGRNTSYRVNSPANYVIIADVYPNETDTTIAAKVKGKKVYTTQRTIKYDLYAPYSPDLHSSDLVKSGQDYTSDLVAQAFAVLKANGVMSRALPGSLVADVFAGKTYFFGHIPLLEQTDLTEFVLDPENTVERAQVIIGANQDQAFNITCNSSSACGWMQFTPGTYNTVVKDYPGAKLIKDFKTGAADHLNSMMAAALLYDENLKGLISKNGSQVLNDPKLEEYLASAYNGAPAHVYTTLKAAVLNGIQDWINALTPATGGLKTETKGYLVKLRWLQEHPSLAMISAASQ